MNVLLGQKRLFSANHLVSWSKLMLKHREGARSIPTILCFTALLLIFGIAEADNHRGILGRQAPELELNNWIDGTGGSIPAIRLNELRGKVIYLYFFQDWCPGCHSRGFPLLKRLHEEFGSDPKVALLAVQTTFEGHYTNTEDKLRKNQLEYGVPIPMAHDAGAGDKRLPRTMTLYRSGGTPWKVIIDKKGTVVFNGFHSDPDQAIKVIRALAEKT